MILIIAIGIGTLFAIALYQMLQRNVIRSAIGVILLGSAINLFLLTAGNSNGTDQPTAPLPKRRSIHCRRHWC